MRRSDLKSIGPVYKLYGLLKAATFPLRIRAAEARDQRAGAPADGIPLPPPKLRFRVHGSLDGSEFLAVGSQCARDIQALLRASGLELYDFETVLDFGCGCARVLRFFGDRPASCRLFGTDIDPELIAWCREQPQLGQFDVNPHLPPTAYPDGFFDFIFSISVFTHLDEDMQLAWLQELRRITRPGGHVLVSLHSPATDAQLTRAQRERMASKGFLYVVGQTGALKLDGLPDFYQSAFHSREYVREVWGRTFEVVSHVDRGINAHQDAVLLRAR